MLATNNGGGFYIDHSMLYLYLDTVMTVTNSKVTSGSGGLFYLKSYKSITISSGTSTSSTSSYSDISAPYNSKGSVLYSESVNSTISISNILLSCRLT